MVEILTTTYPGNLTYVAANINLQAVVDCTLHRRVTARSASCIPFSGKVLRRGIFREAISELQKVHGGRANLEDLHVLTAFRRIS